MIKYPLATSSWGDEEKRVAKEVIDSGICTMGKKTLEVEKQFAENVGKQFCVFSNSGSSANLLAITAMMYRKNGRRFEFGDEIIVPAVSWSTTYYPIYQNRLKMVFVDIDRETLNIDVDKIKNAISPKTKAIFAVNLLGNPCDFNALEELCSEYKLELLIDNCESMGSTYNNVDTSHYGLITTYSSFFSHHISSIEGGFCVTDDEELYQIMISLRAHGWTRGLPDKNFVCDKTGEAFDDLFRFVLPGYNLRPNEVYAAIASEQIKKLPSFVSDRILNENVFHTIYKSDTCYQENFDIQVETRSARSSWFGFSLILKNRLYGKRKIVAKTLFDNGIECRPIVAGDFTKNPVIKYMDYRITGPCLTAKDVDMNGLFIGNNPGDLTEQIKHFFSVIRDIIVAA
jgi:CDP-6-deoxy-D-xylo-4-hexulose-3-dehydrase